MSALSTSNLTSGFIDLASFDEQEKYLYGGPDAIAYFVRETRKSTWFTQVPVVLSKASGSAQFDQEWSVTISRAGDYLLHSWLRIQLPEVKGKKLTGGTDVQKIAWTRNFAHNLISEACITFNDLVAARFDNYHLDFWTAFTVPEGKASGYSDMIGDTSDLCELSETLPPTVLNLPLPFFYCRDSGVALPTAALPYNDMRICFKFRKWSELLLKENSAKDGIENATLADVESEPVLSGAQVWCNYAIVSNDERKRMACAPRDILIEQCQTAPIQSFTPNTNPTQSFDIRFSHAIKALFFGVRNKTISNNWSNYTTHSPTVTNENIQHEHDSAVDPIKQTSLIYENTSRLSQMGSDYFSLVQPWYSAPTIPKETGYHMYSYSLDFFNLDPMGSTNFGKLTNVSIVPEASSAAITAATVDNQTYSFIVTAINNNIIRVSGGALGFPVL